jgi:hypothetical protein
MGTEFVASRNSTIWPFSDTFAALEKEDELQMMSRWTCERASRP